MEKDIIYHAIDALCDGRCDGKQISEMHHEIFNTDYFIIGYYQAEQWLINECEETVFGAIEKIKNYEQEQFGEVFTDLSSSEHVVNMYTYIRGEELFCLSQTLNDNFDDLLTDELKEKIIEELLEQL